MAFSGPRVLLGCKAATLCLALALVAGCGKSDDRKTATQVAARVGSTEITVHQVNNVLARAQNLAPEAVPTVKREILNRLIDQTLARQQATQHKLDRTPAVMQTIEAAKTEILAQSYIESIASAQAKPTDDDVAKYYAAHPELFAQRRVYQLEEIVASPAPELLAPLKELLAKARSMAEVAAWLKQNNAPFAENRGVRAAEQVALDQAARLQTMKDGEIGFAEQAGRVSIYRVLASQAAPVDLKAAAPRIQQFLFNVRLQEATAKEIAQLKEKTQIEYLGEFAEAVAAAAPPAWKPAAGTDANMEKGLKGLR